MSKKGNVLHRRKQKNYGRVRSFCYLIALLIIIYNIASRAAQSISVYVSVLKTSTVRISSSKSLQQNFFSREQPLLARGKILYFVTIMDTNRDSADQSQNEDNFPTFSLGPEFLNEAEKEKSNGKGDSAAAQSRFASLFDSEVQQILADKHAGKTKQMTSWSVSTFKVRLKVFRFKIVKYKTRAFNRKFEVNPIPILLNISLNANNHFRYCRPFFASDLMHNSTGYVKTIGSCF